MIPKKARKKPVVIEYMPWLGGPTMASEVIDWALSVGGTIRWHDEVTELRAPNGELSRQYEPEHLSIDTLEGRMTASIGDVIIRGVQGEFYPCKPDVFEQTYEDVTEESRRPGDPVAGCRCGCCTGRLGCTCLGHPEDERCDCAYCIEFHEGVTE